MTKCNDHISVILLAGGFGERMKSHIPKQFLFLKGKPIISYSLELFSSCTNISEIVIVCEEKYQNLFFLPQNKPISFAKPGRRRQDSVESGFAQIRTPSLVCIHDSARPLLFEQDLQNVLSAGREFKAAALATPIKDTIKQANSSSFIQSTLERSTLWAVQTPQVITSELLQLGLKNAKQKDLTVTDDVQLIELIGKEPKLVHGSYLNMKITTPDDLTLAEKILDEYLLQI